MTPDLSLVTSEELANELMRRVDAGILATRRKRTDKPDGTEEMDLATAWVGGELTCIGLALVVQQELIEALRKTTKEV